jgi:hydroxymethylpyrimidine pyrophosphatase-like HAD family hydrolase
MVPKGIDKGVALLRLAQKYNIKKEEIICIGDSENDVPMLQVAGLAVAVENGTAAARRAAHVIAPKNSEDGVAWVIEKYGFLR